MRPIVVIPFASEVHKKEYYIATLDIIKRYIMRHGVEVHNAIITDPDNAEKAGKKYSEFLPIALILTGGTSALVESFVDGGRYEYLILLSHAEHNSLASALSSRNKVERKGIISLVYHCSDLNSIACISTIDRMVKVARAVATVIGLKVGVVADREVKNEIEEAFESKFKARTIIRSFDKFLNEMERLESSKVDEAKEKIAKILRIDPQTQDLDSIARLYLALRKFIEDEGLEAVTIDCFPFILRSGITPCIPLALLNAEGITAGCEADLTSLLGLVLAKSITGKSGWIANIVDVHSNRCYLAHCTIALDVVKNQNIVSHFETGRPYALVGEYLGDSITMISIDRDFTIASIAIGKVIASGDLGIPACRTQMVVELDYPIELLPNIAPNNHHIIMIGDNRKELIETLYMLGLDVVEYREMM